MNFEKKKRFFIFIYNLQLKTVMERCEKIPAETFESRNRSNNSDDEPRLWPRVDREGKPLGDSEYVVPSPPEREQAPSQTLSHADLEAYVRSYQDPQTPQVHFTLEVFFFSLFPSIYNFHIPRFQIIKTNIRKY